MIMMAYFAVINADPVIILLTVSEVSVRLQEHVLLLDKHRKDVQRHLGSEQ